MKSFVLWQKIALLFFIGFTSGAYQPVHSEKLHLVPGADKLTSHVENGEPVQTITGHVHLKQDVSELHCDVARFWQNRNYVILTGNVFIDDGEHQLYSDHATYDGDEKVEYATGHVLLITDGRQLKSKRLFYYQEERKTIAEKNVHVEDLIHKAILYGQFAEYFRNDDYVFVEGNPVLTVQDSSSQDTLVVKGLRIEGWGDRQEVLVTDSVIITKGKVTAHCQQALFNVESDWITLMGTPRLWQDEQLMFGDTIKIHLVDNEIKGGQIIGKANIVSTDSTKKDALKGHKIFITAMDDSSRQVIVEGQAISVYHVPEEEGDPGVNQANGDRLELVFKNNKLHWIKVESNPGISEGKYEPDRVVREEVVDE